MCFSSRVYDCGHFYFSAFLSLHKYTQFVLCILCLSLVPVNMCSHAYTHTHFLSLSLSLILPLSLGCTQPLISSAIFSLARFYIYSCLVNFCVCMLVSLTGFWIAHVYIWSKFFFSGGGRGRGAGSPGQREMRAMTPMTSPSQRRKERRVGTSSGAAQVQEISWFGENDFSHCACSCMCSHTHAGMLGHANMLCTCTRVHTHTHTHTHTEACMQAFCTLAHARTITYKRRTHPIWPNQIWKRASFNILNPVRLIF